MIPVVLDEDFRNSSATTNIWLEELGHGRPRGYSRLSGSGLICHDTLLIRKGIVNMSNNARSV